MKVLIEYGFRYALEVGFNPKRNVCAHLTILSPAGE
jgi:hypothetical protein